MSATDPAFDALCDGPIRGVLDGAAASRARALRGFWLAAGGGAAAAVLLAWLVPGEARWWILAFGLAAAGWAGAVILGRAAAALKRPVLEAVAAGRGLDYAADGFQPDAYDGLHAVLGRPTGRHFADRFAGAVDDRAFALYEARLTTGSGKSRRQVFWGVVHALRRRTALRGEVVVVPDRGVFNFFKPGAGLQRVRFEDPAFEKVFEAYASDPVEARTVLDAGLRARLLAWRGQKGRLFLRLHGDEAVVAVSDNRNRFEAGSLLRATPPRERARRMYAEVDEALARVRDMAAALR